MSVIEESMIDVVNGKMYGSTYEVKDFCEMLLTLTMSWNKKKKKFKQNE